MKIDILVSNIGSKGGVQKVITDWILHYKDTDKEIRIILPAGTKDDSWTKNFNVKINRFGNNRASRWIGSIPYLLKYVWCTKANVIVVEQYRCIPIIKVLRFLFNKKFLIVSWMHQTLTVKKNMAMLASKADYHLAISSGIKKQFIEQGVNPDDIFLIYNPIERKNKQLYKSPKTKAKFIYVGRALLDGQKNLREMFSAFSLLKEYEWSLDLFGVDEKDNEDIVRDVKEKGISDRVTYRGWVEDPWKNVSNPSALLLTSKYEGLPLVLAEAISYGVPVISSNIETGPDDIVVDNVNGFLYESGNIEDLKRKLLNFIKNASLLSQNNIENTINEFYYDRYFAKLDAAFTFMSHLK